MNCPNCGAPANANNQFCQNCGTDIWRASAALQQAAPTGPVATVTDDPSIRNYAMGVHLIALAGLLVPLGNIIGPLVMWLIKREQSPVIDAAGKEAMNFQISCTIYAVISALMIFILIGIPLLFVVGIISVVFAIVAAVKASNGEPYRYPLTIRFLR
jgi:uncharacterized protein